MPLRNLDFIAGLLFIYFGLWLIRNDVKTVRCVEEILVACKFMKKLE